MALDLGLAYRIREQNSPNRGPNKNFERYTFFGLKLPTFKFYGKGIYIYYWTLWNLIMYYLSITLVMFVPIVLCYLASTTQVSWHRLELFSLMSFYPRVSKDIINKEITFSAFGYTFEMSRRAIGIIFVVCSCLKGILTYLFSFFIKRKMDTFDNSYQSKTIKVSDYTVYVKNLPIDLKQPEDLTDFFQTNYGAVYETVVIKNDFNLRLAYLKQKKAERKLQYAVTGLSLPTQSNYKGSRKSIGALKSEEKKRAKKLNIADKNLKGQRMLVRHPVSAFITFENQSSVVDCLYDFNRNKSIIFMNRALQVDKAREPSNIIFRNIAYTTTHKLVLRIVSNISIFVIILLSLFLIGTLFGFATQSTKKIVDCAKFDTTINPSNDPFFVLDDAQKDQRDMCNCLGSVIELFRNQSCVKYISIYTILNIVSLIFSIISGLLKFLFGKIIRSFVRLERDMCYSVYQSKQMTKVLIYYVFCSSLIVLIVNADLSNVTRISLFKIGEISDFGYAWFRIVGISVLYSVFIFTISPHFMMLLFGVPWTHFWSWVVSKLARSQKTLNANSLKFKLLLSIQYATVGSLFLFTCFYGDLIPVLFPFAIIASGGFYFIEKVFFVRYYRTPPKYDLTLAFSFLSIIKNGAIIQMMIAAWVFGDPTFAPVYLTEYNLNNKFLENYSLQRLGPRLLNMNTLAILTVVVIIALVELNFFLFRKKNDSVLALVYHPNFKEAILNKNNILESYKTFADKIETTSLELKGIQKHKKLIDSKLNSSQIKSATGDSLDYNTVAAR